MRLYAFTNMYLSSLQCGLQTAHLVSELFSKYHPNQPHTRMKHNHDNLMLWANEHKTIIILNGGPSASIQEMSTFLAEGLYPHATFHEDEQSLNGAITVTGVILHERLYNYSPEVYGYSEYDMELLDRMSKCRLAN